MPSKKSAANQKLGRSIRSAREKRYSQEGFARHAGFDRSNYGAIERGEFNVSLDTIVKVAAGLDTTVAALCEKAKYDGSRSLDRSWIRQALRRLRKPLVVGSRQLPGAAPIPRR